MFDKCPTCGATTVSLHSPGACPKCGTPFSTLPAETTPAETTAAAPGTSPNTLGLPQRKNPSLGDRTTLEKQKMRHNMGIQGIVLLPTSWQEELEDRPHDIPFYTGPDGIAYIAVLLAQSSIPQPAVLDEIARTLPRFFLHCKAFLDAGYPILRMNLCIPDNPADPLWLESPLDLRDGDVQDFIEAVQAREQIGLILIHEADLSHVISLVADASGIAVVLREEIRKALRMPMNGGESAFRAAIRQMEQVFPTGAAGLDPHRVLKMAVSQDVAVPELAPREDVDFHAAARQIIALMKPYFEATGKLTEAGEQQLKEIGSKLHRGGGKSAMLHAFKIVDQDARTRYRQSARMLEIIWGGVGDWRS